MALKKDNVDDIERWNNVAVKYAEWLQNSSEKGRYFQESLQKVFFKRLTKCEGTSLLDLGCGEGSLTFKFNSLFPVVWGIDSSEKMIEIARKQFPQLSNRLIVGDVSEALPFNDNLFDIVASNMVLMDMRSIRPTIQEVYRILKSKGKFIFSICHPCFTYIKFNASKTRYLDCFSYEKFLDESFESKCINYHRPIHYYIQELLDLKYSLTWFEEVSTIMSSALHSYYLKSNAVVFEFEKG